VRPPKRKDDLDSGGEAKKFKETHENENESGSDDDEYDQQKELENDGIGNEQQDEDEDDNDENGAGDDENEDETITFGDEKFEYHQGCLSGNYQLNDSTGSVAIYVKDKNGIDEALEFWSKVYDDVQHLDEEARKYAAFVQAEVEFEGEIDYDKVYPKIWDEENEEKEIPAKEYIERLGKNPPSISIQPLNDVEKFHFYYDDDDMFFGHIIEIPFDENFEPIDARIQG